MRQDSRNPKNLKTILGNRVDEIGTFDVNCLNSRHNGDVEGEDGEDKELSYRSKLYGHSRS